MASLTAKVLKGSVLSFAIKFVQKSLGLISTLILARLLTPDDFGIVAIAALVLHFCDVLSTAGSEAYLIQKSHLDKEIINSSWTLELLLKSLLFIIFLLSAPLIAKFYDNPDLVSVLSVSSLVLLLNAFKSPSIALLKKELQYKRIFILNVTQKLIVFTFIMIWAFIEPSFWALIIGDVVSAFVLTVGSYFIHSYRPKLCTSMIKEQFNFSKWIMLKSGVGYSRAQMDVFFVAVTGAITAVLTTPLDSVKTKLMVDYPHYSSYEAVVGEDALLAQPLDPNVFDVISQTWMDHGV